MYQVYMYCINQTLQGLFYASDQAGQAALDQVPKHEDLVETYEECRNEQEFHSV